MEKGNLAHEQPSSTGWGALFFVHTAKDVSAVAVTPPSPSARLSLVFSSKGDSGSPLEKLQMIGVSSEFGVQEMLNGTTENVKLSRSSSVTERATDEHHFRKVDSLSVDQGDTDCVILVHPEIETDSPKKECVAAESVADICDSRVDYNVSNKQPSHEHILNAILPLLRYQQYDSSDSSSR
ncbi:hypothetical protein Tco_0066688 [Tanacetum coccineum]